MADATKLPTLANLTYFQWSRPGAPNPRLVSGLNDTDVTSTLYFTDAPKDRTGTIITTPFLLGVRNSDSFVETIYCPNGADGALGLSATGCVRGIDISGIDYTVGDANFKDEFAADDPVFCNIPAVFPALIISAIQGVIATGGAGLIVGTDATGTATVSRSTGAGTNVGWMRWLTGTSKVQYSNDGTTWINQDDVTASDLVKISATDTTPGYLMSKITAGANVTVTQVGAGGNETLSIASSSPNTTVAQHATYTPAFLTGDTGAQSNYLLWHGVTNGSFRITIDGTAYNVGNMNFASAGSMVVVAMFIQIHLRDATGGLETVTWDTNHFVITSANTTSSSAITVLSTSTGTVGTDISGAGASDWMDADAGNGVVTNKVLNKIADAGKVIALDSEGLANPTFYNKTFVAGESITAGNALYLKTTDGLAYKLSTSTYGDIVQAFIGFAKANASTGSIVNVNPYYDNHQTGLTVGSPVFGSNTAGVISHTPGTVEKYLGMAISTTEVITNQDYVVKGTLTNVAQGSTSSQSVTMGFRPKVLIISGSMGAYANTATQAPDGNSNYQTFVMFLSGTTAIGTTAVVTDSKDAMSSVTQSVSAAGSSGAITPGFISSSTLSSSVTRDGTQNCTVAFTISNTGFTMTPNTTLTGSVDNSDAYIQNMRYIAYR